MTEKRERHAQEKLGRASTLYPRSLELLETLGLAGEMTQAGFVARSSAGYRDGKRVTARGWHQIFAALATSYHDYILNIRQANSQDIFGSMYKMDFGKDIHHGWEITHYELDTSPGEEYKVIATISHPSEGEQTIRW